MARTILEHGGGQADSGAKTEVLMLSAEGRDSVEVPGNDFIANAEITRDGQDLVLTAPSGEVVVIEGYFSADAAPTIVSPEGTALTPSLVNSFVQHDGPAHYAGNDSRTDASPVGTVQEVKGEATVTHPDGSVEKIAAGTAIYEGDIVETSADGAVNIVFIDETTFAVSNNARMAIDEYVFDPATESGSTDFSVLRGMFVFSSGLIGRDDPDDVKIDTPAGSIGIRGTIIAGNVDTGEITVCEGAIVLRSHSGREMTLAGQFETARFDTQGNGITNMGMLNSSDVASRFSGIGSVTPTFFSGIGASPAGANGHGNNGEHGNAGTDGSQETPAEAQHGDSPQGASEAPAAQPAAAEPGVTGEAAPAPQVLPPPPPTGMNSFTGTAPLGTTSLASAPLPPPPQPISSTVNAAPAPAPVVTTAPPPAPVTTTAPLPPPPAPVNTSGTSGGSGGTTPVPVPDLAALSTGGDGKGFFLPGAAGMQFGYSLSAFAGGMIMVGSNPTAGVGGNVRIFDAATKTLLGSPLLSSSTDTSNLDMAYIGDFNGDGQGDVVIGSPNGDNFGTDAGGAVIRLGGGSSVLLTNPASGDHIGMSVTGIGDIDRDGYDDVLIGAPGYGPTDSGAAYVIFGTSSTAPINISSAFPGFKILGIATGDEFGLNVSAAGDFNGDGRTDFLISEPGQHRVHLAFGSDTLSGITLGADTLQINGIDNTDPADTDIPMFSMGDMNGDGLSDIAVVSTAGNGTVHFFFGDDSYGPNQTALASGADFTVAGTSAAKLVGGGAIGDFNGDGHDDGLLIFDKGDNVADIWVLFGNDSMRGTWTVSNFPGNSYHMQYTTPAGTNLDNFEFNVAALGDLNGDGLDDFGIGTPDRDSGAGGVTVVYGQLLGGTTMGGTGSDILAATHDDAILSGAQGNDTLADGGHLDATLIGGGGNDLFKLSNMNFNKIDGGLGTDTLSFETAGGGIFDFSSSGFDLRFEEIQGIERILLSASNNQTLKLSVDNIFTLLQNSDTGTLDISVGGNAANKLQIDIATTPDPVLVESEFASAIGGTYNGTAGGMAEFSVGGYTVNIDAALFTNSTIEGV